MNMLLANLSQVEWLARSMNPEAQLIGKAIWLCMLAGAKNSGIPYAAGDATVRILTGAVRDGQIAEGLTALQELEKEYVDGQ